MRLVEQIYKEILTLQAFPCISTGIYGYESEKACPVALKTVRSFLDENPGKVWIILVVSVEIVELEMLFLSRWTGSSSACSSRRTSRFTSSKCRSSSPCNNA